MSEIIHALDVHFMLGLLSGLVVGGSIFYAIGRLDGRCATLGRMVNQMYEQPVDPIEAIAVRMREFQGMGRRT